MVNMLVVERKLTFTNHDIGRAKAFACKVSTVSKSDRVTDELVIASACLQLRVAYIIK